MAFVFKQANSQYWYAGWKDESGKRVNRSTKLQNKHGNRRLAQKIADEFEESSKLKRAARQVREVIAGFHQDITGQDLPTATVKAYCAQFVDMKRGEVSQATLNHYEVIFRDFQMWLGERAGEDLSSIEPSDIASFRNHLLTKVSEVTVSKKIKALRAMFKAALTESLVLEEPTAGLKLVRKAKGASSQGGKRAFTVEELELIHNEAHGEWRSMVLFGLYTGQRLGDLATLRWSNVDLVKEEVRISTRKTGRSVVIPMASPLLKHVMSLSVADDAMEYIHPELGALYDKSGSGVLSNQFGNILAQCGLRAPVRHDSKDKGKSGRRAETVVSFHSLRTTAVTLLHDAGIPAAMVEEWVGHDSAEVHRAYVKIGREALKRASDALPDVVVGVEDTSEGGAV